MQHTGHRMLGRLPSWTCLFLSCSHLVCQENGAQEWYSMSSIPQCWSVVQSVEIWLVAGMQCIPALCTQSFWEWWGSLLYVFWLHRRRCQLRIQWQRKGGSVEESGKKATLSGQFSVTRWQLECWQWTCHMLYVRVSKDVQRWWCPSSNGDVDGWRWDTITTSSKVDLSKLSPCRHWDSSPTHQTC